MLGFDALARLPLAAVSTSTPGAVLAVTESSDVAALAVTARHTASLAVTEPADVAALAVTARHTASLAATESSDVAALAVTARHTASLAATEPSDTAALGIAAFHTASLAASESSDVAALGITSFHTASLAATESSDVAALAVTARHTASLAVTEPSDTAALAATARHTASLAVTESSDVAALAVAARHTAALAATERSDVAALTITARHTAALAVTEPSDIARAVIVDSLKAFFGTQPRRRKKANPPKLPPPVQSTEVVIDEASLREIELARFAALILQAKQEALQRVEDMRDGFRPSGSSRTVKLERPLAKVDEAQPARRAINLVREADPAKAPAAPRTITLRRDTFDAVETTPEIRTRVVTLFRQPVEVEAANPVRGSTARRLGVRHSPAPRPDIAKTRMISLRRSENRMTQTGLTQHG